MSSGGSFDCKLCPSRWRPSAIARRLTRSRRRRRECSPRWLLVAIAATLLAGCVFDKAPSLFTERDLPKVQPAPDAIYLDIVFVERPVGDALLGPNLWQHVDQVASLDSGTRARLEQNGFRVGVVGTRPPEALQTLLGLKADFAYEPKAENSKQLVGRQVVIRSGGETEIQVSPYYPACVVKARDGEQTRERELENARCMYRVTTQRVQDGWVRLEFVPQVLYGGQFLRPDVGEAGWELTGAQKAETYYPQRFSIELSVGEMAVLSADEKKPDTLGRLFFLGADESAGVQRLLVVRLSDMRNKDEPFAK